MNQCSIFHFFPDLHNGTEFLALKKFEKTLKGIDIKMTCVVPYERYRV